MKLVKKMEINTKRRSALSSRSHQHTLLFQLLVISTSLLVHITEDNIMKYTFYHSKFSFLSILESSLHVIYHLIKNNQLQVAFCTNALAVNLTIMCVYICFSSSTVIIKSNQHTVNVEKRTKK